MSAASRAGNDRAALAQSEAGGAVTPQLRLAENLALPREIVTAKLAILANSGAGKSYTAMKLAELMLTAGAQIAALDPVGIWFGLLSSSDGKGPGFPVLIFGGAHGHLPLSPRAGAAVATFLVESGASCVLDLSDMLPDELNEFVADFSRVLLRERRKRPLPLHVFFEEADNFAPQRLKGQKSFLMQLAVAKLLKEGRHAGIGWSLISQRAQDVDKTVLDLAETLVALRTVKGWGRVKEWLTHKDVEASPELQRELAELETGGAVIISPLLLKEPWRRIHVLARATFDSSRTPELGAAPITPQLAGVDLAALRTQMAAILERIEEGDPQALQRRVDEQVREIDRLRTALAAKPASMVQTPALQPEDLERVRAEVDQLAVKGQALVESLHWLQEASQKAWVAAQGLRNQLVKLQEELADEISRVHGSVLKEEHLGSTLDEAQDGALDEVRREAQRRVAAAQESRRLKKAKSLSPCATSALWVFAWSGAGGTDLERTTLAVRSVYSPTSGGFSAALTELRSAGLIAPGAGRSTWRLLPAGQARLDELGEQPDPPGPSTLAEVRQAWLEKPSLGRSAKTILEVLLRQAEPVTRSRLAQLAGYSVTSGGYSAALTELQTMGLIERDGRGDGATLSAARILVGTP